MKDNHSAAGSRDGDIELTFSALFDEWAKGGCVESFARTLVPVSEADGNAIHFVALDGSRFRRKNFTSSAQNDCTGAGAFNRKSSINSICGMFMVTTPRDLPVKSRTCAPMRLTMSSASLRL